MPDPNLCCPSFHFLKPISAVSRLQSLSGQRAMGGRGRRCGLCFHPNCQLRDKSEKQNACPGSRCLAPTAPPRSRYCDNGSFQLCFRNVRFSDRKGLGTGRGEVPIYAQGVGCRMIARMSAQESPHITRAIHSDDRCVGRSGPWFWWLAPQYLDTASSSLRALSFS